MPIYKRGWVSPLKALETLSLTLSRGMKRAASPRAEQPPHSKRWLMLKDLEYVNKTSINTR